MPNWVTVKPANEQPNENGRWKTVVPPKVDSVQPTEPTSPKGIFQKFTDSIGVVADFGVDLAKEATKGVVKFGLSASEYARPTQVKALFSKPWEYQAPEASDRSITVFGEQVKSIQRNMQDAEAKLKSGEITKKQYGGVVLENALDAVSVVPAGKLGGIFTKTALKTAEKEAVKEGIQKTLVQKIKSGAKEAGKVAGTGAGFGVSYGSATDMQENKSNEEIVQNAPWNALVGSASAGVLVAGAKIAGKGASKILEKGGRKSDIVQTPKSEAIPEKQVPIVPEPNQNAPWKQKTMQDVQTGADTVVSTKSPEIRPEGTFMQDIKPPKANEPKTISLPEFIARQKAKKTETPKLEIPSKSKKNITESEPFEAEVYRGKIKGQKDANLGDYYSIDKETADLYKSFKEKKTGKVGEVEKRSIRLEKPLRISGEDSISQFESIQKKIPRIKKIIKEIEGDEDGVFTDAAIVRGEKMIQEYAKKQGHDGVVFGNGEMVIIINKNKQVVSNRKQPKVKKEVVKKGATKTSSKKPKVKKEISNKLKNVDERGTPKSENGKHLGDPVEGGIYYHGTVKENKKSLLKEGFNIKSNKKGFAEQPEAFYVGDYREASNYGDDMVAVKVKKGAKIKTLDSSSIEWRDTVGRSKGAEDTKKAIIELRKRGYDAVNYGDEIEILNTKKFEVFDPEAKTVKKEVVKKKEKKDTGSTQYFHGTKSKDEILKKGFSNERVGSNSGYDGVYGNGIYITNDKVRAKAYGEVLDTEITKGLKLYEPKDVTAEVFGKNTGYGDPKKITEYFQKQGYDGIRIRANGNEEVVIFDPKNVKAKNQEKKIEVKTPKTTKNEAPIGDGKKVKSGMYERVSQDLKEEFRDDFNYQRLNLEKDAERAVSLVEKDAQKAYRIAHGLEEPPAGQTQTAISIALARKAEMDGNHALQAELVTTRTLQQIKRGQEIVSEKSSISDNASGSYLKKLIDSRMKNVSLPPQMKLPGNKVSKNKRVIEKIESDTEEFRKEIDKKKLDIGDAQSLINGLVCR